jgi:hypothetical protein
MKGERGGAVPDGARGVGTSGRLCHLANRQLPWQTGLSTLSAHCFTTCDFVGSDYATLPHHTPVPEMPPIASNRLKVYSPSG